MFRLGFVLLFVVFNSTTSPSQLRPSNVSAGDQLSITATKTVLGVGESTQLRVTLKQANGESFDVTHTAGIRYTTSIAILAIPELDGRITCISTNGEPFEITDAIAIYGNLRAQLHLYLRSEGPGQTLTISPAKKTLREGESIEYHIFSKSDGTDLTTSSQNHYLVIARYNTPDADAIVKKEFSPL
jgi:hypothetical protein